MEETALAVLDAKALCFENNNYKNVSVADFNALLVWYNVPKEKMKKAQMVAWWKAIRIDHVPPPSFEKWTADDEQELERLKTEEVDMSETALGKYAERMKQDTRASVIHLSEDEWTELLKLRGQLRGEICNTMMTAMTDDSTDGEREFGGDDTVNDVLNDEEAV